MSSTPGADAPFKYTKESFLGVKDAWVSFATARFSKAAAAIGDLAEKLPPGIKSKLTKIAPTKGDSTGASAPS
jgi:hypothetical protein